MTMSGFGVRKFIPRSCGGHVAMVYFGSSQDLLLLRRTSLL
jgi:hypothetical protein